MSAAASPAPAPARPLTWRELAARGAVIELTPGPVVAVRAPTDVAPDLRAALAWRVEAMRAQVRARAGINGRVTTPVAVLGLELPMAAPVRWRGPRSMYGRTVWVDLHAQRPLPGRCTSCGETQDPGATGDCVLCNAARIAALRAEGALGAPSVWVPPPPRDDAAWRAELREGWARPDPLPPPPVREPWACEVCGATNLGRRDVEGCGRCELKAADVISLARLGGGVAADEGDEEAVFE